MKTLTLITSVSICVMLGACGEKQQPVHSVDEFLQNSILLEATMVRCSSSRMHGRYDASCTNAREAASRLAAAEERARKAELERQFQAKRRALRAAQEAAAEAQRQADEAERRRKEAEYLGIADIVLVEQEDGTVIPLAEGSLDQVPSVDEGANQPTVVLPESGAVAVGDNRAAPEQPQGNPEGGT